MFWFHVDTSLRRADWWHFGIFIGNKCQENRCRAIQFGSIQKSHGTDVCIGSRIDSASFGVYFGSSATLCQRVQGSAANDLLVQVESKPTDTVRASRNHNARWNGTQSGKVCRKLLPKWHFDCLLGMYFTFYSPSLSHSHSPFRTNKAFVKHSAEVKRVAPYLLLFAISLMITNDRPTTLYSKVSALIQQIYELARTIFFI